MFQLSTTTRIMVCTRPADMRKSFNGLLGLITSHFQADPYSGTLFLFKSKRGDTIKMIWWDLDGFAIFAKRLAVGTFRFPDVKFIDGKYEPVEIQRSDLLLLLEGIDTDSVRRLKRFKPDHTAPTSTQTSKVKCSS